jgi:hypothetical protein
MGAREGWPIRSAKSRTASVSGPGLIGTKTWSPFLPDVFA